MNIALDFDNTYTADPELWDVFIALSKLRGHTVKIVTFRNQELHGHPAFDYLSRQFGVETIFTNGQTKKPYCESVGFNVDVWIDDHPSLIVNDVHQWTHDENLAWQIINNQGIDEWKEKYPERI